MRLKSVIVYRSFILSKQHFSNAVIVNNNNNNNNNTNNNNTYK